VTNLALKPRPSAIARRSNDDEDAGGLAATVALLVAGAVAVSRRDGGGRRYVPITPNASMTGASRSSAPYGPETPFAGQQIPWSHDYPLGEQHFMKS
jgi:hypothetical protein